MKNPFRTDNGSVSPQRRTYVTAALAASWVAAVVVPARSALAQTAAAEPKRRILATPPGTPGTTTPANTVSTPLLAPAQTFGNPLVAPNSLRNYVFGPVPLAGVTGAANVGVGEAVLRSLTSGTANTAIGDQALWQQRDGINCVAVGSLALYSAVSCVDCTAVGTGALQVARSGVGATAVGRLSCSEMVDASNNSGFGDSTLRYTTTGSANTAVGYRASEANVGGSENVSMGSHAALSIPQGNRNVAVGFQAMSATNVGVDENVAVGAYALEAVTGGRNVAVGIGAGRYVTSGQGNVFLGPDAGSVASQKIDVMNSIAIGDQAVTTQDNQVVIGNVQTETFVLGGVVVTKSQLIRLLGMVGA